MAVAGYISSPDRWAAFAIDWQRMLERYGLKFFHANELARRGQQFAGWPQDKCEECYAEAISIINRRAHASFAYVVLRQPFETILPSEMQKSHAGPYGWAVYNCFGYAADLAREFYDDPWIDHCLDSGAVGVGMIKQAFRVNHKAPYTREMFRLHSLAVESDKQVLPLQAADILAYELARELPRQVGLSGKEQREGPLSRLSLTPHKWQYTPNDQLGATVNAWEDVVNYCER